MKLSETHRANRVQFVRERVSDHNLTIFHSQYNVIYLDEKSLKEGS